VFTWIKKGLAVIWFHISSILFDKDNNRMSLGRVCFIVVFSMACVMWWRTSQDVPKTMREVILYLLLYNVIKFPIQAGAGLLKIKALPNQSNNEYGEVENNTGDDA
jgi:cytochrome c oxidase assembly factor CtaG